MTPTTRKATDEPAEETPATPESTPVHDEIAATANNTAPADAAPDAVPEGSLPEQPEETPAKPRSGSRNDKLATEVENGRWGVSRLEQIRRLTAAGNDADAIMAEVDRRRLV